MVILSDVEAFDLVQTMLEGVDALADGVLLRGSWVLEVRDWCVLILDRLEEGGD